MIVARGPSQTAYATDSSYNDCAHFPLRRPWQASAARNFLLGTRDDVHADGRPLSKQTDRAKRTTVHARHDAITRCGWCSEKSGEHALMSSMMHVHGSSNEACGMPHECSSRQKQLRTNPAQSGCAEAHRARQALGFSPLCGLGCGRRCCAVDVATAPLRSQMLCGRACASG